MGIPVLILGKSGSGKSASLRNFTPEEVVILNVANKPLPFKNKLKIIPKAGYKAIYEYLRANEYRRYVIDDSQYLLAFEYLAKAKENGFQKFTDMALHFYNMIKIVTDDMSEDTIVYFLHHIEVTENGTKAKTIGKLIDEKITLEGLFSIVLTAECEDGQYYFRTQNSGEDTTKSPMDMFDLKIENDLKFVDTTIRNYYEL